jgi:hypothetical protein
MAGNRVAIYRRTQIAWPTIVPLLVVAAVLAPAFISMQLVAGPWIVAVVYGVVLLLFATLTVTVAGDGLTAAFGIGVVRKSVPFADVVSFARVRNRWFNGWGIHFYPGGTLYNASGLSAVEFKLASGRSVSIGTAEPDALVSAVQQATGKTESLQEARQERVWGGWSIVFGLRPPTAIAGFDSFYVSNGFYRDTIPYASVRSVTLEPALPRIGLKTNGFNAGNTLRGNFRLDGWGESRLYINRDAAPFVVIVTKESRHVVVNFKEPEQTRELYKSVRSHIARVGR